MWVPMLYSKIHRATVTDADLDYEGSISIDRHLMDLSDLLPFQQVQIYNITTGARFETYVIEGACALRLHPDQRRGGAAGASGRSGHHRRLCLAAEGGSGGSGGRGWSTSMPPTGRLRRPARPPESLLHGSPMTAAFQAIWRWVCRPPVLSFSKLDQLHHARPCGHIGRAKAARGSEQQ